MCYHLDDMNEMQKQPTPSETIPAQHAERLSTNDPQIENTKQEPTIDQLKARLDEIKDTLTVLEESEKIAEETRKKRLRDLMLLWKNKIITSKEEFAELSDKIASETGTIDTKIREKKSEYRLARMNLLSHTANLDGKRAHVLDLHIPEKIDELQGKNIQSGGSNAQGVFEIPGENLVIIKKSKNTFQYEGALPFVMQEIQSARIPRVMEVFQTENATYKIMEKASGTQLDHLPIELIADIPQEHFNQFVKDIQTLNDAGLNIDPSKTSNCFYNPELGFVIIDLADVNDDPKNIAKPSQLDANQIRGAIMGSGQDQRILDKIANAMMTLPQ